MRERLSKNLKELMPPGVEPQFPSGDCSHSTFGRHLIISERIIIMAKKQDKESTEIVIEQLMSGMATFWIKGKSPLIFHSMSSKAKHEFLFPKGKKSKAEKEQTMKHDMMKEYFESTYRSRGNNCPTRLVLPTTAVKATMMSAALEVQGLRKTQIGRLVWVLGSYIDVYGVPEMYTCMVRTADQAHTPDMRTRAIVPDWCCKFTVEYVVPTMNETTIGRLINTAGIVAGLGDFRSEKGKGNYGQFELCNESDVKAIVKNGGRVPQDKALTDPKFFDIETEELYTWYVAELKKRGKCEKGTKA